MRIDSNHTDGVLPHDFEIDYKNVIIVNMKFIMCSVIKRMSLELMLRPTCFFNRTVGF